MVRYGILVVMLVVGLAGRAHAWGAQHHNVTVDCGATTAGPITVVCTCEAPEAPVTATATSACATAADVRAVLYRFYYRKCLVRHGRERCSRSYLRPFDP